MSGFYNDSGEDNSYRKTIIMAVCAASVVLLLFLIFLYNDHKSTAEKKMKIGNTVSEDEPDEVEVGKSNLVSSDLDFWDMFLGDDNEDYAERDENIEGTPADFKEAGTQPDIISDTPVEEVNWEQGNPNDGNHIAVRGNDGKDIWYEILDIPKAEYDKGKLNVRDRGILTYDDESSPSKAGIDVSSNNGMIDWGKIRDCGIEYAMIRVAYRDKTSGLVTIDPQFVANITGALGAGIATGVYVESAAINETEAIEEANYAIAATANYAATYPYAIALTEGSGNDRNAGLNESQRTQIAKAFCDNVVNFGKHPMICSTKDFLIAKVDMEELKQYDIWLVDKTPQVDSSNIDMSEFPYMYKMWQYRHSTLLNGINGVVNHDISFVNY